MSYNSGSNRARNFKSASRFALVRFQNYSRDYSLNCTQLGPITSTDCARNFKSASPDYSLNCIPLGPVTITNYLEYLPKLPTFLTTYLPTYLTFLSPYLPTQSSALTNQRTYQPTHPLIYRNQPTNRQPPTYLPTNLSGSNHQSIMVAYPHK